MCLFPENYVPFKVINKLTLNEPAKILQEEGKMEATRSNRLKLITPVAIDDGGYHFYLPSLSMGN